MYQNTTPPIGGENPTNRGCSNDLAPRFYPYTLTRQYLPGNSKSVSIGQADAVSRQDMLPARILTLPRGLSHHPFNHTLVCTYTYDRIVGTIITPLMGGFA